MNVLFNFVKEVVQRGIRETALACAESASGVIDSVSKATEKIKRERGGRAQNIIAINISNETSIATLVNPGKKLR